MERGSIRQKNSCKVRHFGWNAYITNCDILFKLANKFSVELIHTELASLRGKGISSLGTVLNKYHSKT